MTIRRMCKYIGARALKKPGKILGRARYFLETTEYKHNVYSPTIRDSIDNDVVLIFHDESMIYQHECRETRWGWKGQEAFSNVINTLGTQWILSDYLSKDGPLDHNGKTPRVFRKTRVGSEKCTWKWQEFSQNVVDAIEIAKSMYPNKKIRFIYDNSPIHRKCTENSFQLSKITRMKPRGQGDFKSALYWLSKHPDPCIQQWKPKSLRQAKAFLKSCRYYRPTFVLDTLFDKYDAIDYLFLPKCHPDLNPIEKLWAFIKLKIGTHRYRSIQDTENAVHHAYQSLTRYPVEKWFDKCVISPLNQLENI